jgi:hypothetical protein
MEALGGGFLEEMVQTPLGNCSINTRSRMEDQELLWFAEGIRFEELLEGSLPGR